LHFVLSTTVRPLDELKYFPGETNVRMADLLLITKVDQLASVTKAEEHAESLKDFVKSRNTTPIFFGKSIITPEARDPNTGALLTTEDATQMIKGKRVLVIDDGPTLTHGGMKYGAGYVLAKQLGGIVVDPRPYAVGSLKATFAKFPHLQNVLPAMGYDAGQIADLEATIKATPCDAIVIGTPSDITHLFEVEKPFVGAKYELEIVKNHEDDFKVRKLRRNVLDLSFNRRSLDSHSSLHFFFPCINQGHLG
jgi:predicted GTPase